MTSAGQVLMQVQGHVLRTGAGARVAGSMGDTLCNNAGAYRVVQRKEQEHGPGQVEGPGLE